MNETLKVIHNRRSVRAYSDRLIAAQTAVIAAESLGIGSCYIGDILEQYETHREISDLPPYTLPITMLCFGYPTAAARRKMTTRFPREAIVHTDRYRRPGDEELKKGFAGMEEAFRAGRRAADFDNAGQATYFRKFAADFTIELNRSVKEMLKNWE